MINKKLIHFKTKDEFLKSKDQIYDWSIVYIKETREIWTHQAGYKTIPEGGTVDLYVTVDEQGQIQWKDNTLVKKDGIVITELKIEETDEEGVLVLTKEEADELYQEKGEYATKGDFDDIKGKVEDIEQKIKPIVYGDGVASFTLEESSNPQFNVTNKEVVEKYVSHMGGYMLYVDGEKVYAAKLDPSSWDRFKDGTPVTAEIEGACETMVHVPTPYLKGDGKTLYFGGETQYAGMHAIGTPNWVGAYQMSYDSNNVAHSRPDVTPKHTQTISQFWAAAQKLGSQWGLANYGFHCLINALFQARYGNLNSQEVIGAGFFQNSNWEAARNVPMGLLRKLGDGSGKVLYNDATLGDQYPVKLFGFEDLWGKLWEFRPGIRFYMDGATRKAVVYDGNIVSNTAKGREFECAVVTASNAYVRSMECGEYWDMIAQNVAGAGSNTYYCDSYWAVEGGELLPVGGNAYYGACCGLSCSHSTYGFSYSYVSIGARLAFYGEPEIVSGAELVAKINP